MRRKQATPEGGFSEAVTGRQIAPVKLSLDEIDSFAEEAIRWVLQDVGLEASSLEDESLDLVSAVRDGAKRKQLQPAA